MQDTETINPTRLTPEAFNEVNEMLKAGASVELVNDLLAITTDAMTLYAARKDCLGNDNNIELLKAAGAVRVSIELSLNVEDAMADFYAS